MDTFAFDEVIDRQGTNCLKYDRAKKKGMPEDILPLWVADMDFRTAPGITERLRAVTEHGIYGYSEPSDDSYYKAVAGWYERRFGWETKRDWLIMTPGIVYAIGMAIQAFSAPGESVLIQQPVYYPFGALIRDNHRHLLNNPLVLKDGRYEMDFEDLEEKLKREKVKLMLLCSPHNPVGRVWKKEELLTLGELAEKYDVVILSDEIHADFVRPGHTHYVLAGLSEELQNRSIICTAPSKSFNLAGLQASNLFVPNPVLREKLSHQISASGYSQLGIYAIAGAQAAYETGEDWFNALLSYLEKNLCMMKDFINERIKAVKLIEPEGLYLGWLDFRSLGLSDKELEKLLIEKARVWLDAGEMFGPEGKGFQRINYACPKSILTKALDRLENALKRNFPGKSLEK